MNWSYAYNPDIWPALITLALVIFLGAYSWRRRHIPAAKPFTIACVFGVLWVLGVILEISAVDFSIKVFWKKYSAIWQFWGEVPGNLATAGCNHHHLFCFAIRGSWTVVNPS